MNGDLASHPRLERILAMLLHGGTWLGCAVIAIGLVLKGTGPAVLSPDQAMFIVAAGVAIFILLPVLRVAVMLFVFVQERDWRFSAITALVLTIIVLGAVLGAHAAGTIPG